MDLKDIKAIIDLMKKNSISEFELERPWFWDLFIEEPHRRKGYAKAAMRMKSFSNPAFCSFAS